MLEVRGLTIGIAGRAPLVANVDLELAQGSIVGLTGASGVGKTLTARALTGILPGPLEARGEMILDGQPIVPGRRKRGDGVAMMVQHPRSALDPLQTVARQVTRGLGVHQKLTGAALATALEALRVEVGLDPEQWMAYPHRLSGGQCQRGLIAMGLACRPRVLIADEPTSALDSLASGQLLSLLASLPQRHGLGLILISHEPQALSRCDRVMQLGGGQQRAATGDASTSALQRAPGKTGVPVLEAENLGVTMGRSRILAEVNICLRAGRTTALVGRSGCGKTTLARALLHLIEPNVGKVLLDGQALGPQLAQARAATRRRIQIVFQDATTALNPRFSIAASLREALAMAGKATDDEATAELLDQVELGGELLQRFPHQISGGQKQRVAIARALAQDPGVLICDEPVSSLDAELREQVLGLLDRLGAERALALMLISHDLSLVRRYADEVVVMEAGRVVESGAIESLMASPQSSLTRELLAAS
jgi:ABC-type glutathione transport system ATPase component